MVALIWVVSLLLLVGWSLVSWGLYLLLSLGPTWLEGLPAWLASLPYPEVWAAWLPDWQPLVMAAGATLHTVFGWLGAAGLVVVWLVWAVGAAGLLGLAALLSYAVRRFTAPTRQPAAAAA